MKRKLVQRYTFKDPATGERFIREKYEIIKPNQTAMNDVKIKGYYNPENHERTVYVNGDLLNPVTSLLVRKHSPDGFNWGYGGSGPSQLALAICLHLLPKKDALRAYMKFKERYLVNLEQSAGFELEILGREFAELVGAEYLQP